MLQNRVKLNPFNEKINIHQYLLLQSNTCAALVDQIHKSKAYWLNHGGDLFSLGYPLYQAASLTQAYCNYAKKFNGIMFNQFRGLYELIVKYLENYVGQKIFFQDGIAIPGFHIFKFSNSCSFAGGCMHFDLSHQHAFKDFSVKNADNISVIIPLKLPASSCGLDVWGFTYEQIQRGADADYLQKNVKSIFLKYVVGQLNLVHGLYWHRISAIDNCGANEERITFQAHCTRVNNRWILFW